MDLGAQQGLDMGERITRRTGGIEPGPDAIGGTRARGGFV